LPTRYLVTSALPYANGPLHVGHIAGAYLPADIYARLLRHAGESVLYICGSDEHGVPITIAAEKLGLTPQQVADKFHAINEAGFARLGFSFDNYSRTTRPIHHRTSQDFFLNLYHKGLLEARDVSQLYCPQCSRYLPDRYVEGTCPLCGSPSARGDQCETCGRWLEPEQLISRRCKICGAEPEFRRTRHWFFLLSRFAEPLKKWINENPNLRDNVRSFCLGWLSEGLADRAITRDLDWGVPVPLPEAASKVLYVWFDAPIGYISATREWGIARGDDESWREWWQDPATRILHFIGKDNTVFHGIVWPAMLMAHGDYQLPWDVPANEFLNLEGQKISTSRNWAVWVNQFLDKFPPDTLRYYLAATAPEGRDSDFSWQEFGTRTNTELADILGNFVNRAVAFTRRYFEGRLPDKGKEDLADAQLWADSCQCFADVEEMVRARRIKDGARRMMDLARAGNRYFEHSAPWRLRTEDPARGAEVIRTCLNLSASLAVLIEPYLPFTAQAIWKILGREEAPKGLIYKDGAKPMLEDGLMLGEPQILFNKIEDEVLQEQVRLLGMMKEEQVEEEEKVLTTQEAIDETRELIKQTEQATEKPKPEYKPTISYDEFAKMDLRVAKVLSCERVPNTDKLLILQIDLGGDTRQIVAGIGARYQPEELVGKSIVVICNLEPAKIRGVESNGMLLAASAGEEISVLTVLREVPPGSKIK